MELKIWVEGFPRVVCGVVPSTTCEEVIRGLAQALQKTGRFTLLEQWRETERELAPSECPLHLLHRRGEYANEVRFTLRCGRNRTPSRSGVSPVKRSISLAGSPARSQEPLELSPPPQTASSQYASLERSNMRWKPIEKSPLREALSNSLERRKRNQHPVARVAPSNYDVKQSSSKEELLQMVALQLGQLQQQEECLSKLQNEINHLEEQDAYLEKETSAVSQEISKLETVEQEMMTQLRDLEDVPWEERLRTEQDNSAQLQSQRSFYEEKVYEMEQQLCRTLDRIEHLTKELENNVAEQEQEEEMRRQIEELKEELEQKAQESSVTLNNLSQVDSQLQSLDRNIEEQREQIARLEEELKNTNMENFRDTPEMVRLSLERRSAMALLSTPKLTPSLPSSARSTPTKRGLIFNADNLKEAVAMTTTDTLWV